jgi:hypothetical protein
MKRARQRLRLNRETLRDLSARDLARAAGGTAVVEGGELTETEMRPKTNAWTSGVADGYLYLAELCLIR